MKSKQDEKIPTTVRFPKKLLAIIQAEANKNHRSFNGQVIFWLETIAKLGDSKKT